MQVILSSLLITTSDFDRIQPIIDLEIVPMKELIFLVEEAPEGGYTARALGESIFTEADTLMDLRTQIRDAVNCHFEESTQPKVVRLHFVKEEMMVI